MNVHGLSSVPADIILEIVAHLEAQKDLLHLSFVSKGLYESIAPALYANVTLVGFTQCTTTLGMLYRKPGIARHVGKLVVHPHLHCKRPRMRDAQAVAEAVCRIARHLDALNTFIWAGEDMCPYDDMWFGLRMLCPRLRYIGTSVRSLMLGVDSHLFDFSDLAGFSIMLQPQFYRNHIDHFLDDHVIAYGKFWDLLVKRCPNLEELSISGTCSSSEDAGVLVMGRWPRLRRLFLGDIVCDWLSPGPQTKHPFIRFLEAHPMIESMALSRHAISPGHLSTLDSFALPNISAFEGTFDQLKAIPSIHGSLKMIRFRNPIPTRELVPLSITSTLQGTYSLVELRIAFVVHSMYDNGGLLRSLAVSCPKLRCLDLTLSQKPSLRVDSFAKIVRALTQLETLSLALVKSSGEESLLAGAMRITRGNPALRQFRLGFIPPFSPLPLPFALPLPLPPPFALPPLQEHGVYTVHHNALGMPVSLIAHERRDRVWPLGLYVSRSVRRCTIDLRMPIPCSRGIIGLMFDGGRAGDELRVLTLCVMLMVLSVLGFVKSLSGVRSYTIVTLS